MRGLRAAGIAAAVVFALSSAARGEDPSARGSWDGFGAGSWAHTKTTSNASVPGMQMPATTVESKQTLVRVTPDAFVLKVETKTGETWAKDETTIPRKAAPGTPAEAPKVEDLGADRVVVEGQPYDVAKRRTVVSGSTTTTWTHAKLGVLRSESALAGGTSTTLEVTRLAVAAKVGDRSVACREMKTRMKAAHGNTDLTTLTSEAVPGGVVRVEMSSATGPMTMKAVTELVAFEAK